ncbi:hypothetical protein CspeluHIS016_0403330 [Cutaneotrichosporon spelunceum]|uniref:Uncharacterized protein n=1 Tax=Cutaneotrichosporon spelunceum TaxID=1672016 RepID=A0AAD3TVX4_9TREE|nr:hypothetical protein CspeluHIS016_0403330 [Cutaneotrichosporon spelunceum]
MSADDDSFFNPSPAPAQLYIPHPSTDEQSDPSVEASFSYHDRYDRDDLSDDVGLTPDSRAEVEAYRRQVRAEGREYEDEDEDQDRYYDEQESYSEGSSAVFDPDNDPAGFAERLDELAGVMEIGEEEARALRWGPSLRDVPLLIDDFKAVLNSHITSTEWRYETRKESAHPIQVLGPAWAGRQIAQEEETFSAHVG